MMTCLQFQTSHQLKGEIMELYDITIDGVTYFSVNDEFVRNKYPDRADEIILQSAKDKASEEVNQTHASTLRIATGNATIEERDTWSPKSGAAHAHTSGTATESQTAMLSVEAELSGRTIEELVSVIIERSSAYLLLVGQIAGVRSNLLLSISNATSVEDVEEIRRVIRDTFQPT